jgi:hypothetical protein
VTRAAPAHPRHPDWPERLAALIEERRHTPFRWGTQDCCSFAADAVLAMTAHDWLAPHRGQYSDAAGAEAILGAQGLEVLVAGLLDAFGAQDCTPCFVQRGDVALVLAGNELTLGVVLDQVVAAPGLRRLEFVPVSAIQRAWSV